MLGIVSHRYANGDLDVWFANKKFGATYFCTDGDETGSLAEGQQVECLFEGDAFGRIVRISAAEPAAVAEQSASVGKPAGSLRQRMRLMKLKHAKDKAKAKASAKAAHNEERIA